MERSKRWELAQGESNKKDKTKLTPLLVDSHELYCNVTPIMFSRFVCALLSFRAREFPARSETRKPGENIVECT